MAIVFRTAGDWGAGKGSNLSPAEVDGNFYDLHLRVLDVTNNPPAVVSIDHFVVEGALFTIVLTNGQEHGPFVLPVAQWRWTGGWRPNTQYFVGDIVEDNSNIYFIRVQHISEAVFDPVLFTTDGFVYILILAKANQPYDIGLFFNDSIPGGTEVIALHVADRELTINANFPGAQAYLRVATTDTPISLPVYKNDTIIGSITFSPGEEVDTMGGQFGVWAMLDPDTAIVLAIRDILSITLPYENDPSASGLAVTIPVSVSSL